MWKKTRGVLRRRGQLQDVGMREVGGDGIRGTRRLRVGGGRFVLGPDTYE